ncbi:MAG: class I SAM-dependent methyltransferase [Actinomycetota bacterium]|nr:class I SAM-dependent methyltransferase [Actinomycetota bacterium]
MSRSVHEAASGGFGTAAEEYARARPDYPGEAVDRLAQELEIGRRCTVLDIGAGTGKLTRQLAELGSWVLAVEPVEAMRRMFSASLPGVPMVAGVAEALPVRAGQFDAVVCGQAFHWFDGPRALTDIYRVLKPQGRLGLMWNVKDDSVGWVSLLDEILHPYKSRVPQETTGEWRLAFSATDLFGTLHQLRFQHSQELDADGLMERYASASYIAVLPEAERTQVLRRINELARTHPDLAGRSTFSLPYVTELYWCSRREPNSQEI